MNEETPDSPDRAQPPQRRLSPSEVVALERARAIIDRYVPDGESLSESL